MYSCIHNIMCCQAMYYITKIALYMLYFVSKMDNTKLTQLVEPGTTQN